MRKIKIIEVDDNNDTKKVFTNIGFDAISVNTNQADDTFADALFDQMVADDYSIIIDSGGGNDSRKVVNLLKQENEIDNFTFIIPIGKSLAELDNVKDTLELIGKHEQCLLILNDVYDLNNLEEEFFFFFGNKDLGYEPFFDLNKINYIPIQHTTSFEIASASGYTIFELAEIAYEISEKLKKQTLSEIIFERIEENKDLDSVDKRAEYHRLKSQMNRARKALEFLEVNFHKLEDALSESRKNICMLSTKGGVGKSTLSWHLVTQILKGK